MLSNDEIENWRKKYPFLDSVIEDCSAGLFAIIEEDKSRNEGLDQCRTHGYDCTQGESTSWQWYGVRNGAVRELGEICLKDAMSKERFDYVITHEHITTELFDDDTIRIFNLKEE